MDGDERHNLGAHYSDEENILKLIAPLFLNVLWAEFEEIKGNKNHLFESHKKLCSRTFLGPACGYGNFLVIIVVNSAYWSCWCAPMPCKRIGRMCCCRSLVAMCRIIRHFWVRVTSLLCKRLVCSLCVVILKMLLGISSRSVISYSLLVMRSCGSALKTYLD